MKLSTVIFYIVALWTSEAVILYGSNIYNPFWLTAILSFILTPISMASTAVMIWIYKQFKEG